MYRGFVSLLPYLTCHECDVFERVDIDEHWEAL